MAFDYPVNLDLSGRRAVVFGGGPLAARRAADLAAAGADVTVVTPQPSPGGAGVSHEPRVGEPDDLEGAFLAIATGEDAAPIGELFEAAERRGVLFAAVDDVEHSHFGASSQIRRGDLLLTISTAGKAPALAKRLRRELEARIDDAYGELVDVLHRARERLTPRPAPFDVWAEAWEVALDDLDRLLELVRAGRSEEAEDLVVEGVGRSL